MRKDLSTVRHDIQSLQAQHYQEITPCLLSLKNEIEEHNTFVINQLASILNPLIDTHNESRMKILLRHFLMARWGAIENSSYDYTHHPFLPANLACVLVAEWIREEKEAICQVIMPSVTSVLGGSCANVKLDSEENDQFEPSRFMISMEGNKLIDPVSMFSIATQDTGHLFPALDFKLRATYGDTESIPTDQSVTFDLTEAERETIRNMAGDASRIYYDGLKRKHENPSIGSALRELMWALYRGSKSKRGTEMRADFSECAPAIVRFHHIWRALSDETRNKIHVLKGDGHTFCLGDFLLSLFSNVGLVHIETIQPEIQVLIESANEKFSQISRVAVLDWEQSHGVNLANEPNWFRYIYRIIPCAHVISLQLQSIMSDSCRPSCGGINLFELSLPESCGGVEADQLVSSNFDDLSNQLTAALLTRSPILGEQDVRYARRRKLFFIVATHLYNLQSMFMSLIGQVSNIVDFTDVLSVVPSEDWSMLTGYIVPRDLQELLFSKNPNIDDNPPLLYTLRHIPAENWKIFFRSVVYGNDIFFNTSQFCNISGGLTYQQNHQFLLSLSDFLPYFIKTGDDIAFIFSNNKTLLQFDYLSILSPHLKTILMEKVNIVDFMNYFGRFGLEMNEDHFSHSFFLLEKLDSHFRENYFGTIRAILDVLSGLQRDRDRLSFLCMLGKNNNNQYIRQRIENVEQLLSVITLLAQPSFKEFLELIGKEKLQALFSTVENIDSFLNGLAKKDRCSFIREVNCHIHVRMLFTSQEKIYYFLMQFEIVNWNSVLTLFSVEKKLCFLTNVDTITSFLGLFKQGDRGHFIICCSEWLPDILKNIVDILFIIKKFPTIEVSLLKMMQSILPSYILQALQAVEQAENIDNTALKERTDKLNLFLKKALPGLFSKKQFECFKTHLLREAVCAGRFSNHLFIEGDDRVLTTLMDLKDDWTAVLRKIRILNHFISNCAQSRFKTILHDYYGESFFSKLTGYLEKYFQPTNIAQLRNSSHSRFYQSLAPAQDLRTIRRNYL